MPDERSCVPVADEPVQRSSLQDCDYGIEVRRKVQGIVDAIRRMAGREELLP